MSKELEARIKKLESENLDLKFNDVARNSRIRDLETIIQGHLSGNSQQQNQPANEQKIKEFGSGLPQHILDYVTGKSNTL
jgi:hypothetical protein